MKAEGIEYDERMELLQDVSYPKPLEELLQAAYETYRRGHPWVADYELTPKSVVRDLYEQAMTFADFVQHYQLARSEGIVLRYLAGAYKALDQTVPEEAKTEELLDVIAWLGELVRQVDSSLLDEWQQLSRPRPSRCRPTARSRRRRRRSPRTRGRSGCWSATRCSAGSSWPPAGSGTRSASWTPPTAGTRRPGPRRWTAYFEEHDVLLTGADARGPALLVVDERPGRWAVRQIFDDPAGDHDWASAPRSTWPSPTSSAGRRCT